MNITRKKISNITAAVFILISLFAGSIVLVKNFSASGNMQSPVIPAPSGFTTISASKNVISIPSIIPINTNVIPSEPTVLPTVSQPPSKAPFAVESVKVNVNNDSYSGLCIQAISFTFTAQITANGQGIVSYKWIRSDGVTSSTPQTVNFTSAGTQTVSTNWTLGTPGFSYAGWEKMQIVSPNSLESNQATFTLNCS